MKMTASRRKHLILSGLLISASLALVGLLLHGLTLNPQSVSSTLIGKPAQNFSAEIFQGGSWLQQSDAKLIRLSDLRGKPIVLNFWASWCVSCRQEAKFFEEFWQRYRESGVYVVGIAIQDTPEAAREFAKAYGKTYPLGIDVDGKASLDYGVYGVPETFFIDRAGIIRHKETGPMSLELLEQQLQKIK